MTGFGGAANGKKKKTAKQPQINFQKWFNQAIYFQQTGKLRNAESTYQRLIEAGIVDPAVYCNLGIICKNSGRIKEALEHYEQALHIEPNDPKINANIGNLYREIGNLDRALAFTLKSVELDQSSSTVFLNLGSIYRELGETEQALSATVQSIELDADNLEAHQNLQSLAGDIQINTSNPEDAEKAYEILLNREDFFHRKLCSLFIQLFLHKIRKAAKQETIVSNDNQVFQELASDWRFKKSLTLLTPPHQEIEEFLTRLRRELLLETARNKNIPENISSLVEALAIQCFLNEYVYYTSTEEQECVANLIAEYGNSEDQSNPYLPILSCYITAHQIQPRATSDPSHTAWMDAYRELFDIQFREVEEERIIQAQLGENEKITNEVSLKVRGMYEKNPYPRYRFADYTHPHSARPVAESISNETSISKLPFDDELLTSSAPVKVLIAGCGTGNQIACKPLQKY